MTIFISNSPSTYGLHFSVFSFFTQINTVRTVCGKNGGRTEEFYLSTSSGLHAPDINFITITLFSSTKYKYCSAQPHRSFCSSFCIGGSFSMAFWKILGKFHIFYPPLFWLFTSCFLRNNDYVAAIFFAPSRARISSFLQILQANKMHFLHYLDS